VEKDLRVTLQGLSSELGASYRTIRRILKDELGLSKKSARWVPKLLSKDQKQQRVERCHDFVNLIQRRSMAVLNNIVTMNESAVSFHTPETKQQSKQWVKKGQPGPIKARVHATRSKQMVQRSVK
jgi:AraC-like DNA-binding protein